MGLFDSIFGSKQEEIDPGTPQVTNVPTKTAEQTDFTKQLNELLSGVVGGGGRAQGFQGDLTAGTSGLQNQAFDSINQSFAPGGQTQSLLQDMLSQFNPQGTVDRFNEFQRPFAQNNQDESRRQLAEGFAGNIDSGAFLRAANRGETDFNLGLQSQLGNQLNFDETQQQGRNVQGLSSLFGLQNQGLQGGGAQRGIEQEGLSNILQEFIRSQGVDPLLGLSPTALGVNTFDPVVQLPNQSFGQSPISQISSLLGGAGKAAAGGAAIKNAFF